MKILHTSDWHVGKTLYGRSRLSEHEAVIAEILDIAVQEQVDLLVLAGDIYDTYTPPPEAERLVCQFMAELAGRKIPAVILGGNHDHPKRLAAMRPVLDWLSIRLRTEALKADNGGVIELAVRGEQVRIATLPWIWIHRLTPAELMLASPDRMIEKYEQRVNGMIKSLTAGFKPDAVNILAAHLYVFGTKLSGGSEKSAVVADPYAVPRQVFPGSASYVALGHLHQYQEVTGCASLTYYSGSPLQLDFGEQGQVKRVNIIEARPGTTAKITPVALTKGRRLRDVSGPVSVLKKSAADWTGEYLRVTVEADKLRLGMADEVREFLPDALNVQIACPAVEREADPELSSDLKPVDLFRLHFEKETGGEPPENLLAAFEKLYEEASRASN